MNFGQFLLEFLLASLAALVLENILFARALGSSRMLHLVRQPRQLLGFTIFLAAVTTLSGLMGYPLRGPIQKTGYEYIYMPIVYVVCMCVSYGFLYLLIRKLLPGSRDYTSKTLPLAAFNCAVLGGLLIPYLENMSLGQTVGYGLGMALGFAGAVLLLSVGLRRLELCKVPRAFQGLPILLIYLGLLSLAFYGLIGHQLPA